MAQASVRETWSSRTTFLLAAIGGAVGLGNIWRFPFVAGENGGGAFVLIYLVCIFLLGLPLLIAEFTVGRRGAGSPVNTLRAVAAEQDRSPAWQFIGWLAVASAVCGLIFYSVIAGWSFAYILETASGAFIGVDSEGSWAIFCTLTDNPREMALWHFLFMAVTVFIVARGIRGGLEKAVTVMMPALFVVLLILVGYAAVAGDFMAGFKFLFEPDFSKITFGIVLMAMGQAFFTISIGGGGMMTYGAYLPRHISIPRASCVVVGADTLVALLAGFAIFPLVFQYNLAPGGGPGLIFATLPIAFGQMPAGTFFGTLFFVLLAFAALSSSISMLEPAISFLEERGFKRARATLGTGLVLWIAGLGSVFSFNIWKKFHPLGMFELFAEKRIFDLFNYIVANVFMVLGGLFMAIFVGWMMSRATTAEEFGLGEGATYRIWLLLVRFLAPIAVAVIFYFGLTGKH
ncbi:MAG: sodium-dependent transporter [Sphingomonadales bacterium]